MNDDEIPERWPRQPNKKSGEPGRTGRVRSQARRAAVAVGAALAEISRSRGLFAVIGAAAATSIFVLFSFLPGSNSPLRTPPPTADRTVAPGAGVSANNGAGPAGQDSGPAPDRSAQPPLRPAPLQGAPAGEPAPGQPPPAQQADEPPQPGEPAPRDPAAPGQPAPRNPPSPGVQQEKTVRLSTRAGQESVDIDWWRKRKPESHDLRMDRDGLSTELGAKLSVVDDPRGTITYHDCAKRTAWVTRVNFTALRPGSKLCAQSRTGRYATLTVIALPRPARQADRVIFHATTWQLPGQQQPAPRHAPPPQTPSNSASAQPMAPDHGSSG